MQKLLMFFIGCQFCQCSGSTAVDHSAQETPVATVSSATPNDSSRFRLITQPGNSYAAAKQACLAQRDRLKQKYLTAQSDSLKQMVLQKAQQNLTESLLNEVIPYWYGTPWTFEGHTAIPKTGSIACGYFVSTTLLHAGFKINRYRLAQQTPYNEACSIQVSGKPVMLENKSVAEFKAYMLANALSDGLYFIGLYNHVGYLRKLGEDLYFIHSSYLGTENVVIERIEESDAFSSPVYYIAEITSNEPLLKKWLLQEEIKVVTTP